MFTTKCVYKSGGSKGGNYGFVPNQIKPGTTVSTPGNGQAVSNTELPSAHQKHESPGKTGGALSFLGSLSENFSVDNMGYGLKETYELGRLYGDAKNKDKLNITRNPGSASNKTVITPLLRDAPILDQWVSILYYYYGKAPKHDASEKGSRIHSVDSKLNVEFMADPVPFLDVSKHAGSNIEDIISKAKLEKRQ